MLTEILYNDYNGSVCAICGSPFETMEQTKDIESPNGGSIRFYKCLCINNHLSFIRTETLITDDDYKFFVRAMISQLDWENIYCKILNKGPEVYQPIQYEELLSNV